jgi:hypothetical protein
MAANRVRCACCRTQISPSGRETSISRLTREDAPTGGYPCGGQRSAAFTDRNTLPVLDLNGTSSLPTLSRPNGLAEGPCITSDQRLDLNPGVRVISGARIHVQGPASLVFHRRPDQSPPLVCGEFSLVLPARPVPAAGVLYRLQRLAYLEHRGIDLVAAEQALSLTQEIRDCPARLIVVRERDQRLRSQRAA